MLSEAERKCHFDRSEAERKCHLDRSKAERKCHLDRSEAEWRDLRNVIQPRTDPSTSFRFHSTSLGTTYLIGSSIYF